ncbi:unnamed protein product, partial [marine sediment metagenome]
MAEEGKVNWEDDSVVDESSTLTKFWVEKAKTRRILLIEKAAIMVLSHYSRKANRYGRCIKASNNGYCPGCEDFGEPKPRFGTNVYDFKLVKQKNMWVPAKPLSWTLMLWTFGSDKFVALR